MLYKRVDIQNNNDSDSDSGGPMLKQALPVDENLEIDESRPASTAEEYLLRVRLQRQQLPKISYAQIDKTKISKTQHQSKDDAEASKKKKSKHFHNYNKYFESTTNKNKNPLLEPNEKWKQKFIKSFEMKRDILLNNIIHESKWNKRHKNLSKTSYLQYKHMSVPHWSHTQKWLKFALNYTGIDDEKDAGNDNKCDKENAQCAVPPVLTLIQQLSPIETEKLLETFMNFVMKTHENETDYGLNAMSSLWLYALFLRVELPLRANLTANIREFARFCMKQRNKLTENESSSLIVFVNIFIVMIENIFKQPIT